MRPSQSLSELTARLLLQLQNVFKIERPAAIIGHGDTTTCFATALSSFYHQVPFFHVEAGLRTYRLNSPFPEEFNRQTIAPLAFHHFAPTAVELENLMRGGIPSRHISVTGSTVHDSVDYILKKHPVEMPDQGRNKPLVVTTLHRREAADSLKNSLRGVRAAALERSDAHFVCPVHPGPSVQAAFNEVLSDLDNVTLMEPMEYPLFLSLLMRSSLVVTDSGGVQEEATFLGKPVLLARQETERRDGLESGLVRLVGLGKDDLQQSILAGLRGTDVIHPTPATKYTPPASEMIAEEIERAIS